ncbi:MAG: hypothetical protein ACOY3Y_17300 [Acidobacteriota bacterium]
MRSLRVGADGQPGIKVAISNAGFNADWVNVYWDRETAIAEFFHDDETPVAFLRFATDGSYLGANWFWGSGTGCGFCSDSDAKGKAVVRDGGIGGTIALKGEETSYEVTFQAPVAAPASGAETAVDGPAAQAYLAYHKALGEGGEAAVRPLLSPDHRERLDKAKTTGESYLAELAEDHPNTVAVVRAFEAGEWAVLLVRSEAGWGAGHGEVQMQREGDGWRFYDEFFRAGDWLEWLRP